MNYEMFTEAGNEAVQRWIIDPTIEVIAAPTEKNPEPNVRKRCVIQIQHGMEHVAAIGHREVHDTAVREEVYGTIGKALQEAGVLSPNDDIYNWS